MAYPIRIGLIGDYNPVVQAHQAIPRAIELASADEGYRAEVTWLPTLRVEQEGEAALADFDGLWCTPGSPYESMDGALRGIRFARERGKPFLGTCGGFQHAVIEYARNVLGRTEADHAETNPSATFALITPLVCSLSGGAEGVIYFRAGSRIAAIYGKPEATEEFNCNYGVSQDHQSLLAPSDLHITGVDSEDEVRVVELEGHPFFIATLFQPERSAFKGVAHPLVRAFLQAMVAARGA